MRVGRLRPAALMSLLLAFPFIHAQTPIALPGAGLIVTVAGNGTEGSSGDSGAALGAEVADPTQIAVDSAGNIYIADYFSQRVRKVIAATGVMTTIAGGGSGGDGGLAVNASLYYPNGVALDSFGNVYITDQYDARIRKVTVATGIISTVAGNGTMGYSGDGGAATSAELYYPGGVAVDGAGNIYIADSGNQRVREVVASSGEIITFAGTGVGGFSGDGGAAASAQLDLPAGVAVDSAGNVYIADQANNCVREVNSSTGIITTVAGSETAGYSGDGGAATGAMLYGPTNVTVDAAGNIYIADTENNRIRKVTASTGIIMTIGGTGGVGYSGDGGPALSAELDSPDGIAVDVVGNVYVADQANQRIRAIGPPPTPIVLPGAGLIVTVAGNGTEGSSGDGGPALRAEISDPTQIAVDSAGNIYIADYFNDRIREVIAATGVMATIAGGGSGGDGGLAVNASLNYPNGVALDSAGNVYITDQYDARIRKVTVATGIISTVAGNGTMGYFGDGGAATSAELSYPGSVAVDGAGNVYIADSANQRVREVVASSGEIITFAGTGVGGYSGDGGAATSDQLYLPIGVAVDSAGNVYIADQGDNRVREVNSSTGIITTVAGNGTAGYSGEGGAATSAMLDGPTSVTVDAAGNIYIADTGNNRIREVTASSGIITTIGGTGVEGYSGDGGPALSAELDSPDGIAVDTIGNVYSADEANQRIRAIGAINPLPTPALSFSSISTQTYGAVPFTVSAASASTGAVTYAVTSGPATISGSTVTLTGAGTVVLNALQAATTNYAAATASTSFTVNPTTPTLSFAAIPAQTYGAAPFAVSATSASSGDVTYAVTSGPATISGSTVTLTGAGTVVLSASQTATTNYAASTASTSFTVSPATPIALPGAGLIVTVAGNGTEGSLGDGGPALSAELADPSQIAVDSAGNIYIADYFNDRVREVIAATGLMTTIAGGGSGGDGGLAVNASLSYPNGVALDRFGNIYITDQYDAKIREVTVSTGIISTVVGNGTMGYFGDGGAATSAELSNPAGIAVDGAGNVYIADAGNQRVREVVASSGEIITFAGTGVGGYSGDGGAATSAQLYFPLSVAVDSAGNVYIADEGNARVREVNSSTGIITTVAGSGAEGYSGDGVAATSAMLYGPNSVTVDAAGNIYIADGSNNRIREVAASTGIITTIGGTGVGGYSGDGGPALSAELNSPDGVAVDTAGNVYVTDETNQRIRAIGPLATPSLSFSSISTQTYGAAPFTVSASSASSGAVTYAVTSGPATISGSTVTITGAGTVVLSALQAATTNYASATAATSFIVSPATPTLSFTSISTQTYGVAPFTVSAASASSGAVTYAAISGPATIIGSTVTITGAGTVVLSASQTAMVNYAAATATTSFIVNPATPTLSFSAISTQTYGASPFTVSASSASSGAVTYAVTSGPATISGSTATITGAGTVVLSASQTATANYAAATATTSFIVNPATPTLSFSAISTQTYGASPFTVSASSASTGAVTYAVTSGPATISGSTVTITGAGTVVLSASQVATANYAAATASTGFTVSPATPTLSFASISTQTYGVAPFTVSVTSASSGAVTYAVTSGPATISGSTVTVTGVGTVVLSASQAATTNYAAVTASASVVVIQAPTITTLASLSDPSQYGSAVVLTASVIPPNSGAANAAPTGSVTFYDGTTNLGLITVNSVGIATLSTSTLTGGTHSTTAVYSGDGNYVGSTSTALAEVVLPATTTISVLTSSTPTNYGTLVTFTATISNGPTGSVAFHDGGTFIGMGSISGNTATLTTSNLAAGTHTITASWGGNASYATATSSGITQIVNGINLSGQPGIITTVAGTGTQGFTGDEGLATSAELEGPTGGIGTDANNNVYFCDSYTRVRKIAAATGIITTVAGNGTGGYSGDNYPAINAEISCIALAVDAGGDVYIGDLIHNRIRKVWAATGTITTVAGNGTAGYSGDGLLATTVPIELQNPPSATSYGETPIEMGVDAAGDLYFYNAGEFGVPTDYDVRFVSATTGIISTFANGQLGNSTDSAGALFTVDPSGDVYVFEEGNGNIYEVSSLSGNPLSLVAQNAGAVWGTTDASGNLYFAQGYPTYDVVEINAATGVERVVASRGGPGEGCLQQTDSIGDGCLYIDAPPNSYEAGMLAVDSTGNMYTADALYIRGISAPLPRDRSHLLLCKLVRRGRRSGQTRSTR